MRKFLHENINLNKNGKFLSILFLPEIVILFSGEQNSNTHFYFRCLFYVYMSTLSLLSCLQQSS